MPGNDSPFAPAFPSTDPSVPQRTRDVEAAKALLAEAGVPDGFTVKWNVLRTAEVPDAAAIMKENFREAGINTELVVQDSEQFYGDGQFGSSPWLDATMGTVDYGHRGVPNVFLQAQLTSEGAWNAAHFKNPTYDGLVTEFIAALDVDAQQAVAEQIQELLLDETPTIIPYFYSFLGASQDRAGGRPRDRHEPRVRRSGGLHVLARLRRCERAPRPRSHRRGGESVGSAIHQFGDPTGPVPAHPVRLGARHALPSSA